MTKRYILKTADTFGKLEVNKIYKIKDERYIMNDQENIILYSVTRWQLENMFQEV